MQVISRMQVILRMQANMHASESGNSFNFLRG